MLYRAASSGTTEAFTYWLYQAGNSGIAPSGGSVMEGSGGAWKATNIDGVANNAGMAQGIDATLGRHWLRRVQLHLDPRQRGD